MGPRQPSGVRAVRVPPDAATTPAAAYYTRAYGVAVPLAGDRSAEEWARACFDDAPAALRMRVVSGWRAVLRLRLGPSHSPEHVQGWAIRSRTPRFVVLAVGSPLLEAEKLVRVGGGRLTVTTVVRSTGRPGRMVWSLVRPVHQVFEPLLLTRAARRASRATG